MDSRGSLQLRAVIAILAHIFISILIIHFLLEHKRGFCEVAVCRLLVIPQRPSVGGRELAASDITGEGLLSPDLTGVTHGVVILGEGHSFMVLLHMLPQTIHTNSTKVTEGTIVPPQLVNMFDVSP